MRAIKILFLTVLSFLTAYILSFGFWYLIFWFITNERDLFLWVWWIKFIYIIIALISHNVTLQDIYRSVKSSILGKDNNI